VAGLIACKDARLCEAFSCPWPPSSSFYKLLELSEGFNLTCDSLPLGDGLTVMLPYDKEGAEVTPPEV